MAKRPVNNFSEEFFLSKGYTKNATGGWSPPPFKHHFNRSDGDIPIKEKVVETTNFEFKPVVEWFVPYQVPSKKNCQQLYITRSKTGKMIPATTTSQRFKDYVLVTKKYWEAFGYEFRKSVERLNLKYPLKVEFTFIRSTNQTVDYVGPLESVQDIMKDFNWFPDDNSKYIKPSFGDIEVDKGNPGVKIKLLINV